MLLAQGEEERDPGVDVETAARAGYQHRAHATEPLEERQFSAIPIAYHRRGRPRIVAGSRPRPG